MPEALSIPPGYKIFTHEGTHYPMLNMYGEWYYFSATIKDDFIVSWQNAKTFTSWRRALNFVTKHYEAGRLKPLA